MMKRNSIFFVVALFACQARPICAMENSYSTLVVFSLFAPIATNIAYESAENLWKEKKSKIDWDNAFIPGLATGVFLVGTGIIAKNVISKKSLPGIATLGIIFGSSTLANLLLYKAVDEEAAEGIKKGMITGLGTCAFAWAAYQRGLLK